MEQLVGTRGWAGASVLLAPEGAPELNHGYHGDSLVYLESAEMAIAGDDQIGMAFHGAFENPVVTRIVYDYS